MPRAARPSLPVTRNRILPPVSTDRTPARKNPKAPEPIPICRVMWLKPAQRRVALPGFVPVPIRQTRVVTRLSLGCLPPPATWRGHFFGRPPIPRGNTKKPRGCDTGDRKPRTGIRTLPPGRAVGCCRHSDLRGDVARVDRTHPVSPDRSDHGKDRGSRRLPRMGGQSSFSSDFLTRVAPAGRSVARFSSSLLAFLR